MPRVETSTPPDNRGSTMNSEYSEKAFDVTSFARELDRNGMAGRVSRVALPFGCLAMSLLLLIGFLPRVLRRDLSAVGWFGLVGFGALDVWIFATAFHDHSFWSCRRAAQSVSVSGVGVKVHYPSGGPRLFLWSDSKPLFELDDITSALPSFTRVPSTPFWLDDNGRLSALSQDAYQAIIDAANRFGVVKPLEPLNPSGPLGIRVPGLTFSIRWMVYGKPATPV
jgi:hypothetical protein